MKSLATILVSLVLAGVSSAVPDGFIHIRVSMKMVMNPATGTTPAAMDDALLRDSATAMNRWLAVNWRGYRIDLVDMQAGQTFRRVGGLNDTTGPSKWYDINLKGNVGTVANTDNLAFENAAKANKTLYAWNDSAVNIYFNNQGWSMANFPSANRDLVISGYGIFEYDIEPGETQSESYKIAGNLLHELGHFFELYHTQESGGDGMSDTAVDIASPTDAAARDEPAMRNIISQLNYSLDYSALTTPQKVLVDNSANNAMSYHQLFYDNPPTGKVVSDAERFGPTRFLFTEQQMDKWSDYAGNQRAFVTTGITRFVDAAAGTSGSGTSSSPIKTLASAVAAADASGNDILTLRPGTYTASTLDKPVTLRATRSGPVTVQHP